MSGAGPPQQVPRDAFAHPFLFDTIGAMQDITIWSDGSSLGNPGPGGWGAIVHDKAKKTVVELGGANPKTTNNRMEMLAAIEALEHILKQGPDEPAITVNTDSQYLINGITKWVFGWEAKGWKTQNKAPVLNKDLWELLLAKTKDLDIEWRYVEGHAGIAGNERVDEIATSFASGKKVELYSGSANEYEIDIKNMAPKYATPSNGAKASSAKAYSYVSLVDDEVKVHATWKECEDRVKGKKARFKKVFSKAEEAKLIEEWLR